MVYRRRRRGQRGGVFRGKNRQRGRGAKAFFSKIKKKGKIYGKKYGKMAFHHGKRIALAKAKEYAPLLAAKALQKLQQTGNGRQRGGRQRGRGAIGKFLGELVAKGAEKYIPF